MFNEVALEACLNEHAYSDRDPRGDHGEWGCCIIKPA